jgi:DNA-directed RNA polymerase III subunit RPC4
MPPRLPPRGRGGRGRGSTRAAASSHDAQTLEDNSSNAVPAQTTSAAIDSQLDPNTSQAGAATQPRADTLTPTPDLGSGPETASRLSTPAPASSLRSAKFKPKAVRRTEAERIRIAEEQQRLQDERNAEEAKLKAYASRGRGQGRGRGRGRGNLMMRGISRASTAAGPLSVGGLSGGFKYTPLLLTLFY